MLLLEVTIRPTGGDTAGPAKSCAVRAATFCALRPYKHERRIDRKDGIGTR